MSGIEFDKVLEMISGDKGKYQTVMFLILCIPATIPVAFLAFSNVFTSATPDHWCKAPPKYRDMNLIGDDLKFLTIPYRLRGDGEKVYSKCSMYDFNGTDLFDSVLGIGKLSGRNIFDPEVGGNIVNNTSYLSYEDTSKVVTDFKEADKFTVNDDWRRQLEELILNGSLPTISCQYGWTYDKSYYDNTLVTEMNLVCEDSSWPQMSTTFFYIGSLFGNVLFGYIADRWGRRKAMLLMMFLEVTISIATCFSQSYNTYLIFRTLGGFFFPSLYQIPFVLGIEMMGPSHRTFAGMVLCTLFAAAMSILALLAYLVRDWFHLSIVTSVPFLLLISYYWIIPESPRWLVSRGRLEEAEELIQKIAKYNKAIIPKRLLQKLQEESDLTLIPMIDLKRGSPNVNGHIINDTPITNPIDNTNKQNVTTQTFSNLNQKNTTIKTNENGSSDKFEYGETNLNKVNEIHLENLVSDSQIHMKDDDRSDCEAALAKYVAKDSTLVEPRNIDKIQAQPTMIDIFRYPNIRKKFLILTFDWIVNAVVYNGLSYNATNLGVNDFLAFSIAAIIEIPSNILAWKLMDKWGRRLVLCLSLGTGGLGCISCMFVPEEQVWLTVTFAMIGKFGIAASFTVFYVFVGELFPTVLRSQAMGLSSLVMSIGLLTFPYILQMSQYWRVLPLIVLGILSLAGSVVSIFLPETLNTPMPQTLEDGENFGRDMNLFSFRKRKTVINQ